ncbi:hypothetical protein HaLaN_32147 [Haematococcus lacustris]|uniref:Uncharacterized protein n=1 Tax=Haematococcus lacustris TaxID=44745 RepID=A0A6A0AIV2_HAELA|nr:hypothetical protein HaLaN_32147 [Haematococcus lacustris]
MEEALYFGVVPWDRPSASSSISTGFPSMFKYSLFASQLIALGAWEHHYSPPTLFRSLSAGCSWLECSVIVREEVRQEAFAPSCCAVGSVLDSYFRIVVLLPFALACRGMSGNDVAACSLPSGLTELAAGLQQCFRHLQGAGIPAVEGSQPRFFVIGVGASEVNPADDCGCGMRAR